MPEVINILHGCDQNEFCFPLVTMQSWGSCQHALATRTMEPQGLGPPVGERLTVHVSQHALPLWCPSPLWPGIMTAWRDEKSHERRGDRIAADSRWTNPFPKQLVERAETCSSFGPQQLTQSSRTEVLFFFPSLQKVVVCPKPCLPGCFLKTLLLMFSLSTPVVQNIKPSLDCSENTHHQDPGDN